uniref:Protein quiver n=1 Tax=Ascaris lumbricoides TaxID=6252 RepID=A0A0M3I500_ASCLU
MLLLHRSGYKSVFLILVSLPPLNAIHCHANVHETEHHEDCGPDGYCFFLDMSSSKRGIVYYRGCDNILMCEVLAEANSTMSAIANVSSHGKLAITTANVTYEWCAANAPYRGRDERMRKGTLCCCSTDFCNKKSPDEKGFSEREKLERLLDGTIDDYKALYKMAKRLKMPGLENFKEIN